MIRARSLSVACFILELMSERLASTEQDWVVAELETLLASLGEPSPVADEATRLDRITAMEKVKGALAAAQARETVAFKESRLAERKAAGCRLGERGKGVGSEVALARREPPSRAGRLVGMADALVHEMPCTMAALSTGAVSEWRAMILVQETACLSVEHRREVDRRMGVGLGSMSDRQVRAEAKRIGYELDPASIVARSSRAEKDRRVTSKGAPDTMMQIRALLPVVEGAAVMAALTRAADAARAGVDDRSRNQVMADTLVERVTGQVKADQVPVEVQLVMTDRTLLGDDHTPAWLAGYGPVPAAFVRNLLRRLDDDTKVWVRRVFTDPCTGVVSAVDTKRRRLSGSLRRAIIIRDRWCRMPWCGAPIRHGDHVVPVEDGGETTEANTQGLCEACNYAKQAPGWRSTPGPGGAGVSVEITTPTGHTYESRPPPLPGVPRPDREPDVTPQQVPAIEIYLRNPFDVEYAA
jgi:uncharacterized protein DUF222/HNH endonuclease